MKNLLALIVLLVAGAVAADPAPFRHGVNLTEWFQANDVGQIPVSKFGPQDFTNLRSLGVDVVRLPVNFGAYVGPGPEFRLSPVLLDFLDRAVDGLLAEGLTVVLDNHSGPELPPLKGNLEGFLRALWGQLATHYRDRPAKLIYEIQNEPHEISKADWDGIQHRILKVIRQVEADRLVVVTGADWGGIDGMLALSSYDDGRLIYSFHFYDPFVFTHQGADWAKLEDLKGMRFPPRGGVPALAPSVRSSWVANDVKKYYSSDAVAVLGASLDKAVAFARNRQVPIWCGEWGVYSKVADPADRVEWYRTVHGLLDQRSIPWTLWDYRGAFGLFQPGSGEAFTTDLNVPMAEAVGFTAPAQHPAEPRRLTEGFSLYRDQWGDPTHDPVWLPAGTVNFFDTRNPAEGRYSLSVTQLPRYAAVGWTFGPPLDLSALVDRGVVRFWGRANRPQFSFEVRMVNAEGVGDGLPWRAGWTVTEQTFPGDGAWHEVSIPLSSLREGGAWTPDRWYEPRPGSFQWTRVGRIQLVAEQAAFGGLEVGLDELRVGP